MTEIDSLPSAPVPPASDAAPDAAPRPGRPRRKQRGGRGVAPQAAVQAASASKPPARQAAVRQPSPILERLFTLYPKMFGARFLPLKLGVFQELMAAHGEEFKKDDLKIALGQHARSTRYLESVAAGEMRHDLQGEPVEPVAPEHIHHAILEVYRRRQARGKQDARPWLMARLVDAIDAAGLDRQDWDARVGAADEFSVQVLDEAFSELAGKIARREALKRAFEASGLAVEAFADMYGMEPAVVRHALERASVKKITAQEAAAPQD